MSEIRTAAIGRKFAITMAVSILVWAALTAVFAAQFYWMGKDWGMDWRQAFTQSLLEWCPWLVLSPLVVWFASRFRFDRARWVSRILPHLPVSLLVALAYHGLSILLTEHTGMGGFRVIAGRAGGVGFGSGPLHLFGAETNAPPPPIPSQGVFVQQFLAGKAGEPGFGTAIELERTQVFTSIGVAATATAPPPPPGVVRFSTSFPPRMPGPWSRFVHIAAARAQSTIPIYWTIVCVTWVISYYQQLRDRERRTLELEARLTQANLQSLKTQLQPHFLFNTLNAIASLVRNKPAAAEEMIGSLSEFLRMNLEAAQQHEVPLRRELEFLDLYLEIQQTRFGERLRIQKELEPGVQNVAVPTLILQPLVENSVRHGIEPRETGGIILIRAARHEDSLRLEVCDDGAGFRGGQLAALREGIGLSNTKARLQELYGDAHRFQITPNAGWGLTVTVEIPWHKRTPMTHEQTGVA